MTLNANIRYLFNGKVAALSSAGKINPAPATQSPGGLSPDNLTAAYFVAGAAYMANQLDIGIGDVSVGAGDDQCSLDVADDDVDFSLCKLGGQMAVELAKKNGDLPPDDDDLDSSGVSGMSCLKGQPSGAATMDDAGGDDDASTADAIDKVGDVIGAGYEAVQLLASQIMRSGKCSLTDVRAISTLCGVQ